MVFISFIVALIFINVAKSGTEEELLRESAPSFRALMQRKCGATASAKAPRPSFSGEAGLESLGLGSEENSFSEPLSERFQHILQQEASMLQQYRAALQVACDACVKKKKKTSAPAPDFVTLLPEEIKEPQLFGRWLTERAPKDYRYDFCMWHALLKRVRVSRPVGAFLLGRIDESIGHMTTLRRQFVSDFGDFGLIVGKPETHQPFFQQSAELSKNLIDHGAEEETFLEAFKERQGEALAVQQWKVAQAQYVRSLLQTKLDALEVGDLVASIKEHRERLGGRLSKMFSFKMSFYSDAFMFVYEKDLDSFLDAKGGIDQLWKHLGRRKPDVLALPNGDVLYGCLAEQQQNYLKARKEIKEWLARIRAGEEAAPEKSSLKAFMDPKKTLNLDQSFSHAEEEGTTRIRHILAQEAALNAKAGHLEEGEKNQVQDMFDSFIRDLLERDGKMSATYELASLPAKLAHIVEASQKELEEMYRDVAKKWRESTVPGEQHEAAGEL